MTGTGIGPSNELLVKAFQLSLDAIAVTRLDDGRVVEANDAFLRMLGLDRTEVIGHTTTELGMWIDPSDRQRLVDELAEKGATGRHEFRFRTGSGEVRDVELSCHVVDLGGVPCILAIDRDVTERNRTQEALRKQAEEHRRIVETIQEGLWLIDAADLTTYANAPLAAMLGWEPEEMIGRPLFSFMDDEGRRIAEECLERRRQGIAEEHDFKFVRKDGSEVWAILNTAPLTGADGAYVGALATVVDITHRMRAEEALRAAFDREREIARELRALDEMKSTLVEAVSQDVRTPLTTVLGVALTLQRDDLGLTPQETRDLLRRLATNAQKLEHLMSDLVDIDRIRRGIMIADRRHTDLGELVARVVRECDLPVNREVHVHAPAIVSEVDASKVERIVENLVTNTLRHTPAGTPLWVRVEPTADGVLIVVEDAGGGVPAASRTAVFEPFRQLAVDAKSAPGVGVGLALVAHFAQLHGGQAWVEDRPGGGASFRVLLPSAVRLAS